MLVHGAIVPPRAALEAVDAVVRSIRVPVERAPQPAAPRGIRARFGRHRADVEPDAEPPPAMLEHVPLPEMRLPITAFGNLTTHDVHRLTEELRLAAGSWRQQSVCFAGGTALDFPGDWSVWAKVEGDLDALSAMARSVPQAVERLGFFVDRRKFRPMLSVATVTTATTGPFLQEVVDALDAFRGEEWPVELSLLKETFVGSRPEMVEFERIVPVE
jgi:2'-5' RNA ligase